MGYQRGLRGSRINLEQCWQIRDSKSFLVLSGRFSAISNDAFRIAF